MSVSKLSQSFFRRSNFFCTRRFKSEYSKVSVFGERCFKRANTKYSRTKLIDECDRCFTKLAITYAHNNKYIPGLVKVYYDPSYRSDGYEVLKRPSETGIARCFETVVTFGPYVKREHLKILSEEFDEIDITFSDNLDKQTFKEVIKECAKKQEKLLKKSNILPFHSVFQRVLLGTSSGLFADHVPYKISKED